MRCSILAAGALAASAVVLSGNAARADATPTGVEVGLRSGYALPFGDAWGARNGVTAGVLSRGISGMIPIWVDAGYRLNPNMMVGAYVQYGIAFINNSNSPTTLGSCARSGVGRSANDLMLGVQFHYHFLPVIHEWR